MTISFPISLPASFELSSLTIRQCGVVGKSTSPITGIGKIYEHPGQWWEAELTIPPPKSIILAEEVVAAFMSLRGKAGSLLMGDPLNRAPRGVGGGTPVVDGASQTGNTLAVRGGPLSTTNWLRPGDWLQLGSGADTHLHKCLAAGTTDGTGRVTLDIWPRLRTSPADGATITLAPALGHWELGTNRFEYTIRAAMTYGFSVPLVERM